MYIIGVKLSLFSVPNLPIIKVYTLIDVGRSQIYNHYPEQFKH